MKLRRRHLAIAAAVLVLCAGAALVATGQSPFWSFLTLVSLILAACGTATATYLYFRVGQMQGDIDRLARSLDSALRDLAAGNERNSLSLGTLSQTIDRQIGGVLERIETQVLAQPAPTAASVAAGPDAAVSLGMGIRKLALKPGEGERLPAGWADREMELSLEPIISVSRGAAAGFEVHTHILLDDGTDRLVRRLSSAANADDLAAFELALVKAAIQASRRQLGPDGADLQLHVAVSAALLGSPAAVDDLAELLGLHPRLARSVVFSLPADLFGARNDALRPAIAKLSLAGALLAAEGWPAGDEVLERLKGAGVGFVKATADRLLDRERPRRKALSGGDLAERLHASGIAIVATGVTADEDAVALLDLGVDLMCGDRFSPPRKLKPAAPDTPAIVAGPGASATVNA